jgi:UDP-N-acetylmuramate dehydrogenase
MVEENFSLKKVNTFGIDAAARYFARFSTVDELEELLRFDQRSTTNLQRSTINDHPSILILGGGSNILFTKNFDGLVLKNEIQGIEKIKEDKEHVYVKAGAGVNWHRVVIHCIDHNWAGIENLSLIPGNTGASPMQNIGAYGVELKEVFFELEAFHLNEKRIVTFNLNDCEFGYRDSIFKRKFKNEFVITTVTLRLKKKPVFNTSYGAIEQELKLMGIKELSIQTISQAVINIRRSKLPDPAEIGNAGSFFKNPETTSDNFEALKNNFPGMIGYKLPNGNIKLAAGWLIEQCGWKGYRKGDAGCHAKQALVLVNYGNANGAEIYSLSEEIIDSVRERFGIVLEREVNMVNGQ